MNILIDQNNVALFFGGFKLTDNGVQFDNGGVSVQYTTENSSVVDTAAPTPSLPNVWKWENDAWVCIDQAAVDTYNADQVVAFNQQQRKNRELAYTVESDPIFFKWQRGESTQQEWLDKVEEIKNNFPYRT